MLKPKLQKLSYFDKLKPREEHGMLENSNAAVYITANEKKAVIQLYGMSNDVTEAIFAALEDNDAFFRCVSKAVGMLETKRKL
jgi:hypothetical protein